MRKKGKIASWNDDKGFGFIRPLAGGKEIFMHITALSDRSRTPTVGDVVTYAVSKDKQGRPCADKATLAGQKLVKKAPKKSGRGTIVFSLLFVVGLTGSALLGHTPVLVPFIYALMSVVTFFAYALDKSAAKSGSWRTSEGTLLMLGLAGGWPGALLGQQILRHKSKKTAFRSVFWTTVVMNCLALAWLHTEAGMALISGDLFGPGWR